MLMQTDKYQKLSLFHFAAEMQSRPAKKNFKCVIFGNFGAMNLGDEAILAGEIREIQTIPNASITVVGRYPDEIKRLHNVNAISLYQLAKIRRVLKKADAVIVGGGGLINKAERNLIGFSYQLYMLFVFFFLPRFYRRKLYILGIGIYDNANPLIVNIALPLIRYANIVTVRDHHSYIFLKSKHILALLYKDNSFLMDLLPVKQILQKPYIKENYRKERQHIGISLVKPETGPEEKHLVTEMAKFFVEHQKNTDFWFYPADSNPEYEGDGKMLDRVLSEAEKLTKKPIVVHQIPKTYTPQDFFSTMKLMNGFVAMRLHAAIFAYRNNVPFAGISYDKKCTSFLESIGKKPLSLKNLQAKEISRNIL